MQTFFRTNLLVLVFILSATNALIACEILSDTLMAHQQYAVADSLYKAGNYDEALEPFLLAATGFENEQSWSRSADCLFFLSKIYERKAQLAESAIYANKILNDFVPKIDTPNNYRAKAFMQLGSIATRYRNLDEAVVLLEKAIEELSQPGLSDNSLLIDIYQSMGKLYYMRGEIDKSTAVLQSGVELAESHFGSHNLRTAACYNNLGNIFLAKDDHLRARKYYEKAIKIRMEEFGEDHNSLISSYANIGTIDIHLGNYEKSIFYLKKALQLVIRTYGNNHPRVGYLYRSLAEANRMAEKYHNALVYLKKAIQINQLVENADMNELAELYMAMSKNYTYLENYEQAIYFAKLALSLNEKENSEVRAKCLAALSFAYLNSGDYPRVIELSGKAKSIFTAIYGSTHEMVSTANGNMGVAHQKLGNYNQALELYDQALYSNFIPVPGDTYEIESIGGSIANLKNHLWVLTNKSSCLIDYYLSSRELKYLDQAISLSRTSDSLTTILRSSHYNERDKIAFSNHAAGIYEAGIKATHLKYLHSGDDSYKNMMFSYAEKTKSNLLKQMIQSEVDMRYAGVADSLIEMGKLMTADIRFLRSELQKVKPNLRSGDSAVIASNESKIFELSRSYEKIVNTLRTDHPNYFNLKMNIEIASLDEIQDELGDHTTLIEYFVGDGTLYTFVVDQDSLFVHQRENTDDLDNIIDSLRIAVVEGNYENYLSNAFGLYQILIQPIREKISNKRLLIIPDGKLWHVNFDLLLDSDQKETYKKLNYLMQDFAISYGYSADLIVRESKRKKVQTTQKGLLAFSFNKEGQKGPGSVLPLRALRDITDDLPGSRAEIKAISSLVDGDYYYGSKADKNNFKVKAKNYSVLHLAVHGSLDEDDPMNSKLLFTPSDSIDDGALYAYELYNMTLNTDLAVLSACNTGAGQIAKGEGIMSLGRAFTYAGCKSLVLTQWEIPDETAPQLMKYFYQELKNGKPKDMALQQAKINYLTHANEAFSAPVYWGSFVLLGDNSSIDLADGNGIIFYAIAIFTLVLIVGIIIRKRKRVVV